jgi:excisionase family DNA binding protein
MTIKPLYTFSEVAALLGKNVSTIKRWVKAKKLPVVRPGGPESTPMVPIAALQADPLVWESLLLADRLNQARRAA